MSMLPTKYLRVKRRQLLIHCRDGRQDQMNIDKIVSDVAHKMARGKTNKTVPKKDKQVAAKNKVRPLSPARDVQIYRGKLQYLYDVEGVRYLDCQAGVCHVGHAHPHILAVMNGPQEHSVKWAGRLQGNGKTRAVFIEKVKNILPKGLSEVVLLNSGSEANELAIQMAQAVTGGEDMLVFENAFHGCLSNVTDCSPITFQNQLESKKPWVHILPIPDLYRGVYWDTDPDAINNYLDDAKKIINDVVSSGRKIAALLMEPLFTFHDLQRPHPTYVQELVKYVRSLGAVLIIDEVQTGLGRLGDMWGHTALGVQPDILTVGKPLSNGFPLALLATSSMVVQSMAALVQMISVDVVNTNISRGVLEVMEKEKLLENAKEVGEKLIGQLEDIAKRRGSIGQIRGSGLMLAIDLVKSKVTRERAPELAQHVLGEMKKKHVLIAREGNVIYLMPPLCFTAENGEEVCNALEDILAEAEEHEEDSDGFVELGDSSRSSDYADMD